MYAVRLGEIPRGVAITFVVKHEAVQACIMGSTAVFSGRDGAQMHGLFHNHVCFLSFHYFCHRKWHTKYGHVRCDLIWIAHIGVLAPLVR